MGKKEKKNMWERVCKYRLSFFLLLYYRKSSKGLDREKSGTYLLFFGSIRLDSYEDSASPVDLSDRLNLPDRNCQPRDFNQFILGKRCPDWLFGEDD